MAKIGITTTIPVEAVYAGGHIPVDLNNIFITHPEPGKILDKAEFRGFPRTLCSWVKGIYGVMKEEEDIRTIVAVIEGDCSNTIPLIEILKSEGIEVITFAYRYVRDREHLVREMDMLIKAFNTDWNRVRYWKKRLDRIRKKVHSIDLLSWREGNVSGLENHLFLVNTSDFKRDPDGFEGEIDEFLKQVEKRPSQSGNFLRIGYVGVPPIFGDLYQFVEDKGGKIIFNEVQRQFAMPQFEEDIIDQYLKYTYPYGVFARIQDIKREISTRNIQGIIHYVQTFCHHQIEHIMLKEELPVPVLLLEGDRPGVIDTRTKLRLESFLEMFR